MHQLLQLHLQRNNNAQFFLKSQTKWEKKVFKFYCFKKQYSQFPILNR